MKKEKPIIKPTIKLDTPPIKFINVIGIVLLVSVTKLFSKLDISDWYIEKLMNLKLLKKLSKILGNTLINSPNSFINLGIKVINEI